MRHRESENKPGSSPARSITSSDESGLVVDSQSTKSKRNNRILLLALLIMIFSIAQIILMLSTSSVQPPGEHTLEASKEHIENIEVHRDDLKATIESLDDAELDAQFNDAEAVEAVQSDEKQSDEKNLFGLPVSSAMTIPAVEESSVEDETLTEEPSTTEKVATTETTQPAVLKPITESEVITQVDQTVFQETINRKPDFIKYDEQGNELPDDSESWVCVADTNTGLMWEVKAQDDTLRDSDNLYTWYRPESEHAAGESDGGRCTGDASCDTHAYVQALNEKNFCGHNDWVMPTRDQMQSLVDLRNSSSETKINSRYFPYTMPSWYWTSSDEQGDVERAWYVLFRNGFALRDLKERPKHIRLVRKNSGTENL